jgi:hypothetical protein
VPSFSEVDLKAYIAENQIGGISLDTSVFDAHGRNLTSQALLGLRKFRSGVIRFLLSEVVAGEVRAHFASHAATASAGLHGGRFVRSGRIGNER